MELFAEFISRIENDQQRQRTEEVLNWVQEQYPQLVPRVAWNQPMFTDHGTFIIAFSLAKPHLAVAPEQDGIEHFAAEIKIAGLSSTNMIVRFPWTKPVNYELLAKMIEFNLTDKINCTTFWRK